MVNYLLPSKCIFVRKDTTVSSFVKPTKNGIWKKNRKIFSAISRGYFPVIPGGHSLKEVFEIGSFNSAEDKNVRYTDSGDPYMEDVLEGINVWPRFDGNEKKAAEFKAAMLRYFQIMASVSEVLTDLLARALKIDHSYFTELFPGPNNLSTFRLIRYPPRNEDNIQPRAIVSENKSLLPLFRGDGNRNVHVSTSFVGEIL